MIVLVPLKVFESAEAAGLVAVSNSSIVFESTPDTNAKRVESRAMSEPTLSIEPPDGLRTAFTVRPSAAVTLQRSRSPEESVPIK